MTVMWCDHRVKSYKCTHLEIVKMMNERQEKNNKKKTYGKQESNSSGQIITLLFSVIFL